MVDHILSANDAWLIRPASAKAALDASAQAQVDARTIRDVAAVVTTSGPLVAGIHNPVDASSGPLTMTLPTGLPQGTQLSVGKFDTTANVITITGPIDGVSGSTRTLSLPKSTSGSGETTSYLMGADGSWWTDGGHKSLGSLDARYPATVAQVVNVSRYVPAGVNISSTDCSSYFNAAFTAAGVNGTVEFSGQYRCDYELVMLNFQRLRGINPVFGTGGRPANCLDFTNIVANAAQSNEKVGVRLAASNILENFLLWGPGDQVALSWGVAPLDGASTSPRFHRIGFHNWSHGTHIAAAYYTSFYDCEWHYNAVGLYADSCYNMHLYNPRMQGNSADGARNGMGIQINGLVRGLNIHGGSIENYSTAILGASHSNFFLSGLYFETNHVGAILLDCIDGGVGQTVSMIGCVGYLLNHAYVVRFTHQVSSTIDAHGNKYIYNQYDTTGPDLVATPTTPLVYGLVSPTNCAAEISGDSVGDCYHSSATNNQLWGYTDNIWIVGAIQGYHVKFPYAAWDVRSTFDLKGRPSVWPSRTVTASSTLLVSDVRVKINSASATTQKLPGIFAQIPGRTIRLKNIGAGTVTVATAEVSGVTIEGSTSLTTGQSVEYELFGGNWIIA